MAANKSELIKVRYCIFENVCSARGLDEYISYGIQALSEYDEILESIEVISHCKERAEEFAQECNELELELVHLNDAVSDFMYITSRD